MENDMKKLVEEINKWAACFYQEGDKELVDRNELFKILSRYSTAIYGNGVKTEESLAELAHKKRWYVQAILPPLSSSDTWDIELCSTCEKTEDGDYRGMDIDGDTYAAAEQAARKYLEGLEDTK